jgi:hypothetical protein
MKIKAIESVVHDWVSSLPFTQQAVLLLSLRGADGVSKNDRSKFITQFIRGVVLKPAYPGFSSEDDYEPDGFMRCDFQNFVRDANYFHSDVDMLPHHFYLHLIHAAEIIGYSHPDELVQANFLAFYNHCCKSFHMIPETREQLFKRLSK